MPKHGYKLFECSLKKVDLLLPDLLNEVDKKISQKELLLGFRDLPKQKVKRNINRLLRLKKVLKTLQDLDPSSFCFITYLSYECIMK
jgi:hypothetical protein